MSKIRSQTFTKVFCDAKETKSNVIKIYFVSVSIHIGDSPMARGQHLRSRYLHFAKCKRCGSDLAVVFAIAQESRTYRKPVARPGTHKHRGPCSFNISAWHRPHLCFLRLSLRRCCSRYDQTTASAKFTDYTADRSHDRRRQ